jgi:hypothetical protein
MLKEINHKSGTQQAGLGSASKGGANRDLIFLSQSWSRCPAEKWVPALLEGVWTRVSATLHES